MKSLGLFVLLAAPLGAAAPAPPSPMKLFLLIGQSNMAGRGKVEPRDQAPHPRVFVLNQDLQWVPAAEPLHWDKLTIGVGPGKAFGEAVAEAEPGATIGLIPAAYGGSSLDEWTPGYGHYVNAVWRAREAMKRGTLAGILWHQGEADSPSPSTVESYTQRFGRMIAQLRADLNAADVPVIVGELGHFRPQEASTALNAVLRAIPQHVPRSACVVADGLKDKGDALHFDSASARDLGRRYAEAWRRLAGK